MYIPNYDKHNYPYCRLQLVVDIFGHIQLKSPKSIRQQIRNHCYKTLGISVINRHIATPSLLRLAPSYRCLFTPTSTQYFSSTWQYQKSLATWRFLLNPSLYLSIPPPPTFTPKLTPIIICSYKYTHFLSGCEVLWVFFISEELAVLFQVHLNRFLSHYVYNNHTTFTLCSTIILYCYYTEGKSMEILSDEIHLL